MGPFINLLQDLIEPESTTDQSIVRPVLVILERALKHRETFWVKAKTKRDSSGAEFFQYTDVVHTRGPLLGNFSEMLRMGGIELDYALHEKTTDSGLKRTRDHGYLFKIWQQNLGALFPPSKEYSLIAAE